MTHRPDPEPFDGLGDDGPPYPRWTAYERALALLNAAAWAGFLGLLLAIPTWPDDPPPPAVAPGPDAGAHEAAAAYRRLLELHSGAGDRVVPASAAVPVPVAELPRDDGPEPPLTTPLTEAEGISSAVTPTPEGPDHVRR